jgi:hypothetical protein
MSRVVVLTALFAIGICLPLGASLTVSTEFRDVVSEATLIVRGQVTDVRAIRVPGSGVESVGTIAIESVIKGSAGPFVSIRVPGGQLGRVRYVMAGVPTLRPGGHAVFFLTQAPDNTLRPIGLALGIFRVHASPGTAGPVVHPPVVAGRTAPIVGRTARGDRRRTLMPVTEFESLVRLVMAMPAPPRAVPRGGLPGRGGR